MNEAETRAEHIDPALKTAGWGVGILLTLATGTGKTFIAFQIAWKLVTVHRVGGTERKKICIESKIKLASLRSSR